MERVGLAVMGAGAIGRRHADLIAGCPEARLTAVIDPAPAARHLAERLGADWFAALADVPQAELPEGLVVATPNGLHVAHGLAAVAAGIAVLVEKPLSDRADEAHRLVAAAEARGVPLLTGHHRRHNPIMRAAKAAIDEGRLGTVLSVQATCWFFKPDDYFEPEWRRRRGAGPVLSNLVHDVDNLRHLCGEVASVQALESRAVRGFEVEETAGVLLRFAAGTIATIAVSDSVVAPWSWELTTGENPAYPQTAESCYLVGGTHASLSLPSLSLWANAGARHWMEPIAATRLPVVPADPLALQILQFCRVIRGREPPLVSGREGLATLRVIEAVKRSAQTGERVVLGAGAGEGP